MQPIWNEAALTFRLTLPEGAQTFLAASELHVGLESTLARQGAYLRSRTADLGRRLVALGRAHDARRLVLLGDIKHRVTHLSPQERRDVPALFERLLDHYETIDVALGNHDAGLRGLLPRARFPRVRLHGAGGFLLRGREGSIACLHGHAWPRASLLTASTFLVGHTHCAVALVDEHGQARTEWAWLRGELDSGAARKKYKQFVQARVVIFPPFNPLCGGTAVNRDGILGPFAKLVDAERTEAHLLDGRALGTLARLRAPRSEP